MGSCCGAPVGFNDEYGAFNEDDRLFQDNKFMNEDSPKKLVWHAPNYGDKKELDITVYESDKKDEPTFRIPGLGLQWEVEKPVPIMDSKETKETALCVIKVDPLGAPHLYVNNVKTLTIRKWPNGSYSYFTYSQEVDSDAEATNCSYTLIEKGNRTSFLKGNVKPSGSKGDIVMFAKTETAKGFAAKEYTFSIGPNVDIRLVLCMFALKEYSKDQHRA